MKYIDESLKMQKEFFKSGKSLDLDFRIDNLKKLKKILVENEDRILAALYDDLNKSSFEAYSTELGLVYEEINYMVRNLRRWARPKRVASGLINFKSRSYILREPYGNSLIISPWNYPLLLTLSPLLGSMAAGNTSLIKPSEHSVHTSRLLEELINNNFDRAYIHIINGGLETSQYILTREFDYIFYTGSGKVGKLVMKNAAENLTPLTLELGGKSPTIVDKTAKLDLAARRIVWGKFLNAGQTCVAPDYILVDKEVKDEFIEKLIYHVDKMVMKDKANYPKLINSQHFDRLLSYLKDQDISYQAGLDREKLKIYPHIVDEPSWDSPLMEEEIFGPILPIKSYDNIDQAMELIKSLDKPLALYVFSEDRKLIDRVLNNLSYGGGCVNDTVMQLSNLKLPFGGVGKSGMGNYHGEYSFKTFSHEKAILDKASWLDIPIRYQPYADKFKLIKKILR